MLNDRFSHRAVRGLLNLAVVSPAGSDNRTRALRVIRAMAFTGGHIELSELSENALKNPGPSTFRAVIEHAIRSFASVSRGAAPTWVVCGDARTRTFLAGRLEEITTVTRLGNASDALDQLKHAVPQPALMLIDETLGDGSGLELLTQLREDDTVDARILFTGSRSACDTARALGADFAISDPLAMQSELTLVVEAMLGLCSGTTLQMLEQAAPEVTLGEFRRRVERASDAMACGEGKGWSMVVVEQRTPDGGPRLRVSAAEQVHFCAAIAERLERVDSMARIDPTRAVFLLDSPDPHQALDALAPPAERPSLPELQPDPLDALGMFDGLEPDQPLPTLYLSAWTGGVAEWSQLLEAFDHPCEPWQPDLEARRIGRSHPRVVIADDSVVAATYAASVLRSAGLEVAVYGSGTELAAMIDGASTPVDVFVLDLFLPGLDGLQLHRRIRAVPRYQDVPVMLLTGSEQDRHHVMALQSGVDDYVVKPVGPNVLLERVRRLLAKARNAELSSTSGTARQARSG